MKFIKKKRKCLDPLRHRGLWWPLFTVYLGSIKPLGVSGRGSADIVRSWGLWPSDWYMYRWAPNVRGLLGNGGRQDTIKGSSSLVPGRGWVWTFLCSPPTTLAYHILPAIMMSCPTLIDRATLKPWAWINGFLRLFNLGILYINKKLTDIKDLSPRHEAAPGHTKAPGAIPLTTIHCGTWPQLISISLKPSLASQEKDVFLSWWPCVMGCSNIPSTSLLSR